MQTHEAPEREPLLSGEDGSFGFTNTELAKLLDPKNPELLREWGGTDGILKGLRADTTKGLSSDEDLDTTKDSRFKTRRAHFGKNVLPDAAHRSFLSLVWEAYQDKTLIMLSIAAIISLVIGINEDYSPRHPEDEPRVGWVEGAAILAAVAAVIFTNSINDYQKERQFRKLNAKKEARDVKLIRDGKEREVSIYEINVGDILLLEPGDIVPADGIYLEGHNLTCDESSATGESDAMKKNTVEKNGDPFVLSGSKVLEGMGRVVVVAVGPNSFFGKTMMALRGNEHQETPLQIKLGTLAENIAKLGVSVALLMLLALTLKFFIKNAIDDTLPETEGIIAALVQIVIQAITIIVVAVPEGLPMAVTLALAYATTQMLKDNNLVRVLSACETMGNATTVCSDKTGTLTENRMTVVTGVLAQQSFPNQSEVPEWGRKVDPSALEIIKESIAVNSSAFEGPDEKNNLVFIGSKTECALLDLIKGLGADYREIRDAAQVKKIYPFASEKKTMTTVVKLPSSSEYRVHVKGASEIVLSSCTQYVDSKGKVHDLNGTAKENFNKIIDEFARNALRTICLAYRDVAESEFSRFDDEKPPNAKLVCLGVVGIEDPLRNGVVESVKAFEKAGVVVRMITGDNITTAKAIARKAGILTRGHAMSGPDFRELEPEERLKILPQLQVLARSSPQDKTLVVNGLKELGEVVAVTGDGTNDGPALKLADVGFSMGITGTEVAKEASSIILMDDNFNSIVKALKWGRAVNDSVRKFLQFQLTVNITAVILSFTSAVLSDNSESILTAVQLLWVNLIMDTLAALALATEPPTDDLLERFPLKKDASLISYRMWKMIIGEAIFQIVINLMLINLGPKMFHLDDSKHDQELLATIVFNTFVFLQVFNEINCRHIDDNVNVFQGIWHNHVFIIVQIVVILGQIFIVEFGGVAFGTVPLTVNQWIVTVLIGALSLPVGVVIRLLPNACIPDHILNEEHKPPAKSPDALWGVARQRMKVFSTLRKPMHRSPSQKDAFAKLAAAAASHRK